MILASAQSWLLRAYRVKQQLSMFFVLSLLSISKLKLHAFQILSIKKKNHQSMRKVAGPGVGKLLNCVFSMKLRNT